MGKRRNRRSNFPQHNVDEDADVDDIDPKSSRFFYDDIDQFHARRDGVDLSDMSGSEQAEDADEHAVLDVDLKDVYGDIDEGDQGSDKEDIYADIPSSKAWGKKRSAYYGAEDVTNITGADREDLEDAEEEEALKIQQRLAEEIDEDQFELFQVPQSLSADDSSKTKTEKVDIDIHSLSTKAQWKLLKQESPELKELVSDFKLKSNELQNQIIPLLNLVKSGKVIDNGAIYVQTKFNLYLSYLINISFYMSLKAKRANLAGHPIIKRLAQYRTLINKISRLDRKLEEQIGNLLKKEFPNNEKARIDTSQSDDERDYDGDKEMNDESDKPPPTKRLMHTATHVDESYVTLSERLRLEEEKKNKQKAEETTEVQEEEEDRRGASDKIKKNVGYMNKGKKKLSNPRARHREKFRRAKIRRRGKIREYRPELEKYSGEATGIKANLIRSRSIR